MNKKKCFLAVIAGVALLACLVGCAHQTIASASTTAMFNGVTATQATPKDEVKFRLQEDSECEACHALEVASSQDELCLAGNPEHAEVACLDCHLLDSALEGAHRKLSADSKEADGLKRTEVGEQSCLTSGCHTYEEVLANTPEDAYLVDANGTAVNPHEIQGVGQSHKDIMCSDCHVTHQETTALDAGQDTCLSCHHANVYECGTCH
ncbi:hypothetical protein [uncultured Slackia sp.]|uniref:hypothetical protein n=1 Tax=uncultured Slackia sp. TaxID=665903 RepID=UPI0025D02435|nr:hypothetical protein [uncultured Slackia sp.]